MATNKTGSADAAVYPSNIEEKLGFDKVRELIGLQCATDAGRNALNTMVFMTDPAAIRLTLQKISETGTLSDQGLFFRYPEDPLLISELSSRSEVEGLILYEDDLFLVHKALNAMEHNLNLCRKEQATLPALQAMFGELQSLNPLIQLLDRVLDPEGKIRPNASPVLWEIHKKIDQKEKEVRRILHARFETARKNGWAGDTEITIRNERLVIPIIAEFKKKMPGFIHDDSQSGKFLYIEPIECFEENNALKELYLDKKKEIEQILRNTTAALGKEQFSIRRHLQFTVQLDTLSARAAFSRKLNAAEPKQIEEHDACELINARHPLLFLLMSKNNRQPVPLHFHFKKGNHMLVISGPNAGGKSIALKTMGLLQYMYQCGLPIPASSDSKLSVYRKIFIDIGDNQSLENNLSSYSSHLMNMKYFMEHADRHTLYLIDELGNGTDPAIGSTIAQAILEKLLAEKAVGIVTTHFGNLKNWASNTEGVQNARMLYDLSKLEPLFILEPDKPGSSFALEVASKAGIAPEILQRARKISQYRKEIDLDELLAENEKNKKGLEDARKRMEDRELRLERLIREYDALKESLNENKRSILEDAKGKASEMLRQANQKIELTIREIREKQAEKEKTKALRHELDTLKETLRPDEKPALQKPVKTPTVQTTAPLRVGSVVRHPDYKVSGEILNIRKKDAEVLFGQVKIRLPLAELHAASADKKHIPATAAFNVAQFNKQSQFRAEIDLRGVRGEEAIQKLDEWLHDAHMLGMYSLRIIHGRGYGILRKLIIEHLKSLSFVDSYEHESEQLGGDGVTMVRIH